MTERGYINAAQQRILQMLMCLAGHEIDGIAPGEMAKALRTSPSNVTRDLANLHEAGMAEEFQPNRWRLTPRVVQVSLAAGAALAKAQNQLDEVRQRFSRER